MKEVHEQVGLVIVVMLCMLQLSLRLKQLLHFLLPLKYLMNLNTMTLLHQHHCDLIMKKILQTGLSASTSGTHRRSKQGA